MFLGLNAGSGCRHRKLDGHKASQKITKRHFFQDIFYWVTGIGLKTTQFFLFKKSQQIRSLDAFKVLAEMGRDWQAD